ncbi:MAG: sulfite exporter TauE/SafE family protein [Gammaproteobacteria bacterium]|nr:sulfite exporter TauE/SafE family protein [Gammaproteobacteria bacterium]
MGASYVAYLVLCAVALLVSGLTLFSGFGVGTLLMPAFAIFFPIQVAVAATAVVHLANNLFKLSLMWRYSDWGVVARFAIPGALMAAVGAFLLTFLADLPVLATYSLGARLCQVTIVKLVIGALIALVAVLELVPALEERLQFRRELVPLGGALSGFFGGLSGLQGALRSAVLIRCGLEKEAFIGTGVVCAVVVDLFRLATYGVTFFSRHFDQVAEAGGIGLVAAATLAAFIGAFAGSRLMKKVTMKTVQRLVGVMLILVAIGLGTGII